MPSDTTLTPNMSLVVPTVGVDPGPDWANNINASLGILDQHNHAPGSGVQITPSGLNINANLPMNSNNLTTVKTVNFQALSNTLAGTAPNLGCIYVAGNELIYNDEAGNVVPITKTGSVNAGSGSITGLPSGTASASYSSGSETFVWQSATSTPANLDAGSVIFRNISSGSDGVTVSAPSALGSNYGLVWPQIPSQTSYVTLDTSGNFSTQPVGPSRSIGASVGVGGVAGSLSSGSFSTVSATPVAVTNVTITITTSGRPVKLDMISDGTGGSSNPGIFKMFNGGASSIMTVFLYRAGSQILCTEMFGAGNGTSFIELPCSAFGFMDFPSAGTYTYALYIQTDGVTTGLIENSRLIAYEI